jgi:nucleotide-binding universal stress UspA family protein
MKSPSGAQAELTLIAVMPLPLSVIGLKGGVRPGTEREEKAHFQEITDAGVRKLADAGLVARGEVVTGDAVSEIAACARRIGANLIVVGHKHLDGWAARWWRGSVSRSLIDDAPCSVLVVITR